MATTNLPDGAIPPAEHGKMPRWLFLIWVALLAWSLAYLALYALPDFKKWTQKPLPTTAERP